MAASLLLWARIAAMPSVVITMKNMAISTITSIAGPSALDAANRRSSWIFAAYIGVLLVTAGAVAFFTWWTWDASNRVQDIIRTDAQARIEEAKSTAAQANKRSKNLEASNLTLRSQVATLETNAAEATKDVAALQKTAADAQAAQQRVEVDLEKQKERTAIAERDLLTLQERVKPRHLSAAQKELLFGKLQGIRPVTLNISWSMSSEDGAGYGEDFAAVFRKLGWTVGPSNMMAAMYSGPFTGVLVGIKQNPPPPQALAIISALSQVGIQASGTLDAGLPENSVAIKIGVKQ